MKSSQMITISTT